MTSASLRLRVVMPVHNAGAFLLPALRSVVAALPPHSEVVVVDDGSSDGSTDVVYQAGADDSRIIMVHHEVAQGVSRALNAGIQWPGCPPYVAVAEHDDIVLPERFDEQLAALEEDSRLAAVSSEGQYVGPGGRVFGRVAVGPKSARQLDELRQTGAPVLISHPAVTYRRDALMTAGLYDPSFDGAQDLELFNRMVYGCGQVILRIPARHFLYRLHDSATSFASMSEQRLMTRYVRYRNGQQLAGASYVPYAMWLASHAPDARTRRRWLRHDRGALLYRRAGLAWLERHPLRFARLFLQSAAMHPTWVASKLLVLSGTLRRGKR